MLQMSWHQMLTAGWLYPNLGARLVASLRCVCGVRVLPEMGALWFSGKYGQLTSLAHGFTSIHLDPENFYCVPLIFAMPPDPT